MKKSFPVMRAHCLRNSIVGISLLSLLIVFIQNQNLMAQTELSVNDFVFDGPLGSEGATIEKIDKNHFKVSLGHAPEHTDWANMIQFQIKRNAKGNALRLDVFHYGGSNYRFNDYFYSYSYDGKNWKPIQWLYKEKDSSKGDILYFPEFEEDRVFVGHQVPLSYEDITELIKKWEQHPHVKVNVLGQSLGGRNIYRLEITDPQSPYPANTRWSHYITNQHPGEHNAQWRIAGMIDWLLSDEGADCRKRSVCHFIPIMSPDAPSHGWYRVNAQGVDGNRSYFGGGADKEKQAHEAYICQKDLEMLMASNTPVTNVWSMHTWQGIVEPLIMPGPEVGNKIGPWTEFDEIITKNDPYNLIKPLKADKDEDPRYWNTGPHMQFGITTFLCEGAGTIYTKEANVHSGEILMKSLAEYYRGVKNK